jgi:2-methylcitrate dehydratase PrpD
MTPPAVTRPLAAFAARTSFDDLPPDLVGTLRLAVLNMLGCCLGGVRTRIGRLHVELAREFGAGTPQATVIGDGSRVSLPFAAYANGNLGFALDYEDMVFAVVHPGFATVGSGLPLAEHRRASGRDLLAAIAVGYEAATRIAMSMQPSPERARHVWGQQFHPFAAAATAGRLLGLSAEEMDVAFGVTATYATVPSVYKYFGPVEETRPMLATRELVEEHDIRAEEVEAVTITTPWGNLVGDLAPAGAVDAQFSLPYTVAATIARLPRTAELYADERLADPALRRLLPRTRVVHDHEADRVFFEEQRILQHVAVELAGGRVLERAIEFPRDRPEQGWPEIEAKFRELGHGVLDEGRLDRVVDMVGGLEELDDVARLAALLVPRGAR